MRLLYVWLCILASALIYPIPFWCSPALWWLSFIYLVPLFYAAVHAHLSFKEGFVWGAVTLTCHLSGVFTGIFNMASGSFFARLIPLIICISVEACYAGIWFYATSHCIRLTKKYISLRPLEYTLLVWAFTSWLYILFMDNACLWLFHICEGYFALHPLLPLIVHPPLLWLVPLVGKICTTLLLVITTTLLTYAVLKQNRRSFLLVLCISSVWWLGFIVPHRPLPVPAWLSEIGVLNITVYSNPNLSLLGRIVRQQCQQFRTVYPQLKVMLLPESAFYCAQLSTVPEIIEFWNEKHLNAPLDLIMGSFRWEGEQYHNTVHWIQNGTLRAFFDKRHAMLLTEHVPNHFKSEFFERLYFSGASNDSDTHGAEKVQRWAVTPGTNQRPCWKLLPSLNVVPYICSELFFNVDPDDAYGNTPILSLCNDSWTQAQYVRNFMYLEARFKALLWQRDIIYVSYGYQELLRPDGAHYHLITAYTEQQKH